MTFPDLSVTRCCAGCHAEKILAAEYYSTGKGDRLRYRSRCIACCIAAALDVYKADPAAANKARTARRRAARARAAA
jgi:hypothetical protein